MKEPKEGDLTILVGVSFDEIAAEASRAVKLEIEKQIEEVTPRITKALSEADAVVKNATAALETAKHSILRYRLVLFALALLCGGEAGAIAVLILHR